MMLRNNLTMNILINITLRFWLLQHHIKHRKHCTCLKVPSSPKDVTDRCAVFQIDLI